MDRSFQFDYAQTVRIVDSAPVELKPGTIVDIVGMTRLSGDREVAGMSCTEGAEVYVVEYINGSSIEVPDQYIEPV